MKTLCAWCGKILTFPIRGNVAAELAWQQYWNETKYMDESEWMAHINAPENVSHGICAECRREKFDSAGDVILVRNRLPQRLMLHAVKPRGQAQVFLTIADSEHFPPPKMEAESKSKARMQ